MLSGKSAFAALTILGLSFAASYAAPDWGAATSPATTTTPTTQSSPWAHPAGTTPSQSSLNQMNAGLAQPRENCAFNAQQTSITVTNTSSVALPAGFSAVTVCNMHQPGMPAGNSACGSVGKFPTPALLKGGTASFPMNFGYTSTTTPSCQAVWSQN